MVGQGLLVPFHCPAIRCTLLVAHPHLFHEYQIYGADDEQKGQYVVPVQVLTLEENVGYHGKDSQTDALLYHFQLHQVEGTAVALKTETVGGHLTAILKKGYAPTE